MALKHFVLTYEAVPDMMERRGPVRPAHLDLARVEVAAGRLVLGGAFVGSPPGSMLVFLGEDESVARHFAEQDPYVTSGLIVKWSVREWTTVIGDLATHPV